MNDKAFLTVNELMEYMNISRTLAYKLVNSKDFPSFRVGKKILISRAALDKLINGVIENDREDKGGA